MVERDENGHWISSGNPDGRPAIAKELKIACQKYTKEAIACLLHWTNDRRNAASSVAAAKELLDRGYGKPVQPTEPTFKLPQDMTEDELSIWIDALYKHVGLATVDGSSPDGAKLAGTPKGNAGQGKAGQ